MPSTGTLAAKMAGLAAGAWPSITEAGPPESTMALGPNCSILAWSTDWKGWISQYTPASRRRRAMSWVTWEPKSTISRRSDMRRYKESGPRVQPGLVWIPLWPGPPFVILSEAKDLIAARHGHEILRFAQDDSRGGSGTRPQSGLSARVLPIEPFPRFEDLAHMSARPRTERFDGLPQGAAELGQRVIHPLRRGRIDSPRHQPVPLQAAQGEGEHPLGDAAHHPLDLVEALRPVAQQDDDQHGPFVADQRQDGADGAAILGVRIGELDGHLRVPWYQICAFLRI